MTTSDATPKRKPSGAAIPGAHPRPINYPKQLVVMVTEAMYDFITVEAKTGGESKSTIARDYIEKGIAAAQADDRL